VIAAQSAASDVFAMLSRFLHLPAQVTVASATLMHCRYFGLPLPSLF